MIPDDCEEMNDVGDCLTCVDDTKYITNNRCCLNEKYFNGSICDDISNIPIENCL